MSFLGFWSMKAILIQLNGTSGILRIGWQEGGTGLGCWVSVKAGGVCCRSKKVKIAGTTMRLELSPLFYVCCDVHEGKSTGVATILTCFDPPSYGFMSGMLHQIYQKVNPSEWIPRYLLKARTYFRPAALLNPILGFLKMPVKLYVGPEIPWEKK